MKNHWCFTASIKLNLCYIYVLMRWYREYFYRFSCIQLEMPVASHKINKSFVLRRKLHDHMKCKKNYLNVYTHQTQTHTYIYLQWKIYKHILMMIYRLLMDSFVYIYFFIDSKILKWKNSFIHLLYYLFHRFHQVRTACCLSFAMTNLFFFLFSIKKFLLHCVKKSNKFNCIQKKK